MEYPKIHSLFKRSEQDHSFIMGDYACEEFGLIKRWQIEEKIDGTNIRVEYDPHAEADQQVTFYGRSKDSQMPEHLLVVLKQHFTPERLHAVFGDIRSKCTLYGEGYGNNIQAAGPFYRPDVFFMLFDILVGNWWLAREAVAEKAALLTVPVPPILGTMSEEEIIAFVQSKPASQCSAKPQVIEGIIARPQPLLLFRNGKPVIWKLKVRDFYPNK